MNAVMQACVHCADIESALRVFDEMSGPEGCGVDNITYATLLKVSGSLWFLYNYLNNYTREYVIVWNSGLKYWISKHVLICFLEGFGWCPKNWSSISITWGCWTRHCCWKSKTFTTPCYWSTEFSNWSRLVFSWSKWISLRLYCCSKIWRL